MMAIVASFYKAVVLLAEPIGDLCCLGRVHVALVIPSLFATCGLASSSSPPVMVY